MKGNIIIDVSFIFECMLSCQLRFFRVNLHSIVYLNVKGVLARSRRHIWSLCDDSEIRTRNFLVRKRTLKHLAKLNECLTSGWVFVYEQIGCGFESRCCHVVSFSYGIKDIMKAYFCCRHTLICCRHTLIQTFE